MPSKRSIRSVQDYTLLSARAVAGIFVPPHYVKDLLEQMDIIGVGSLPIVLLTGFFIGAVLVLQTAQQFVRFGETSLTGDVVALSLVRELGPTISGLMVAGRNASGMASELGSMLVTEQVDAMRAMGTDPIKKLVTPRVVATVLVLPLADGHGRLRGSGRRLPGFLFHAAHRRRRILDPRHQCTAIFRPHAGTGEAGDLRIYPRDRGLLSGTHRARRHAGRRPSHDASRGGGLGDHPGLGFFPVQAGAVSLPARFSSAVQPLAPAACSLAGTDDAEGVAGDWPTG